MKKLLFLGLALITTTLFASDPVWTNPLIGGTLYFVADRDPTPTEPVINSDLTLGRGNRFSYD